jgi:aryl-alcohol dehydrogenase-like predicted oxidoreductase
MRYVTLGAATAAPRQVSAIALGAMRFGTATDEGAAFAILDHFVAAGGDVHRHLQQLRVVA